MIYNEIMVDLETTGPDPNHNAVIQLAAVRFNLDAQDVDPVFFNECLLIPGNRYWDEDTREWWSQQESHILPGIWGRMRDPKEVFIEFLQWCRRDLDGETPILWAKPLSFEYPFLQAYFREHNLPMPFHYSDCQDLRSWCRARGKPKLDRELEFVGTAHDAIHDVLHQISVLFNLTETTDVHAR